jgi:hypothetical protein
MKRRVLVAALAAAGLLGCASQVSAAGFILTFNGVVSQGSDDTNIFGLGSGASLVGQAISETFVVDYSAGANHNISGDAWDRMTYGGLGFITSSVTINNITVSVGSQGGIDGRNDHFLNPGCPNCDSSFSESTQDETFAFNGDVSEIWITHGMDIGRGPDYHPSLAVGPPMFTPADNLDFEGSFSIDYWMNNDALGTSLHTQTSAVFTADSVAISSLPVPEPGAWALMLVGFGSAGAMLRRRSARAAA